MNESITFLKLAEMVIETTKRPLSYFEIWDEAVKSGLSKRVNTKGKTPWESIGAQVYVDIRDNPQSVFYQYSKRPTKFFWLFSHVRIFSHIKNFARVRF